MKLAEHTLILLMQDRKGGIDSFNKFIVRGCMGVQISVKKKFNQAID